MRLRLLHKFAAVLVLVSVLPLTLLGFRLISLGQLGVRTAILELNLTAADKISSEMNGFINGADAALRTAMSAMARMDWENKQTMLSSLLETRREIRELSVLSRDGAEIVKILSPYAGGDAALKKYAKATGFAAARAGKRSITVDPATRMAVFYYPFGKDMALRALTLPESLQKYLNKSVRGEIEVPPQDREVHQQAWPPCTGSARIA